jgi:serine protease Do
MSVTPILAKVRSPFKSVLMGAVATLALGAVAFDALPLSSGPAIAATSQVSAGPASFADIVDKVKSSVVSVKVKIAADASAGQDGQDNGPQFGPGTPFDRFFKQFGLPDQFGQDGQGAPGGKRAQRPMQQAQGSGFFISGDGYIVTNNHVIDHAKEVTITTNDGKTVTAKVVGADPKTDLALLKTNEGSNYPFVGFTDTAPRVGDWVIAVGNPFGLGGTVTAGIVSARGRDIGSGPYDDFLQIDAPVNHGNSGGPTFNTDGQVVGVNTAIFSPSGGSVGIGFAIEASVVKSVIQQLKDTGAVARGWLGVEIQPVSADIADSLGLKDAYGALVAKDQANSPALAAGVKPQDVITAVNGETIVDPKDLARKIAGFGPKKAVDLTVWRGGASQKITVTLGALPNDTQLASVDKPEAPTKDDSLAKYGLTLEKARGQDGVQVTEVSPDGVAADKGLQPGDVIVEAAGKPVTSVANLSDAIDSAKADGRKVVLIRVKSGQNMRFITLPTQAPA